MKLGWKQLILVALFVAAGVVLLVLTPHDTIAGALIGAATGVVPGALTRGD